MTTHPSMNDLFGLLDKWRHFPAFPLEPRSEVLFALFLPTVLEAHFEKDGVKIKPQMIPQLPLKKKGTNQSNNVDFFALSENSERAFLIELKTDMNSWRKEQDCYLKTAACMHMKDILEDLKNISKSRNDKHARQKYYHMWHALAELCLVDPLPDGLEDKMYANRSHGVYKLIDKISVKSPTLEVVYVQPRKPSSEDKQTLVDGFHYIYFKDFANSIKNQGDLGAMFACYLRKWKEDPAKHPPSETSDCYC